MPRFPLAMLARAGLVSLLLMVPFRALALCDGASLADDLSASERAEIDAAVAATPHPRGLAWTARRGGAEITLIGTMHVHDPRHDALMARLRPLVESADLVLLEATAEEEAAMQAALVTDPGRLLITEGPTLPELLDEETWAMLADAAAARQIPPFMAAKFRPWYLTLALGMPPCAMPDMLAGRRGLDHRIMAAAEAAGTPMRALEPWDTLLTLFEGASRAEQLEMLRLSATPEALQSATFVAMLDGYFEGELAEIWEISRIATQRVPGLAPDEAAEMFALTEAVILEARNRAWLPVIEAEAEAEGRVLVAVGGGHLPGEAGLLSLLEGTGWDVARRDIAR